MCSSGGEVDEREDLQVGRKMVFVLDVRRPVAGNGEAGKQGDSSDKLTGVEGYLPEHRHK